MSAAGDPPTPGADAPQDQALTGVLQATAVQAEQTLQVAHATRVRIAALEQAIEELSTSGLAALTLGPDALGAVQGGGGGSGAGGAVPGGAGGSHGGAGGDAGTSGTGSGSSRTRSGVYWTTFLVLGAVAAGYVCVLMARLESVQVKVGDLQPVGWTVLGCFLGALLVQGRLLVGACGAKRTGAGDAAKAAKLAAAQAAAARAARLGTNAMSVADWVRAVSVHRTFNGGAAGFTNGAMAAATPAPQQPTARVLQMSAATPAAASPAPRAQPVPTPGASAAQPTPAPVTSAGAGAGAGAGTGAGAGAAADASRTNGQANGHPNGQASPFARFDELSNDGDYDAALSFIREAEEGNRGNAEWEYRIAKGMYNVANRIEATEPEHQKLMTEAASHAQAAVDADERSVKGHQWLAIILSAVGDFSSTKVRLKNAHLYKEHTLRALELDPRDATLHHMMGRFCFEVAGISWSTRMMAKALGSVPEASFDDALHHFQEADALNDQWIMNTFWLANTLLKTGKKSEARATLKRAVALPVVTQEDRANHAKAEAALAKL